MGVVLAFCTGEIAFNRDVSYSPRIGHLENFAVIAACFALQKMIE